MAALPAPKSPSSLVKLSRWSLLVAGIFYGSTRYSSLKVKEDELRAKEEAERPAREAAAKAEKDRKYAEEMAYLGREVGIIKDDGKGGGSGGACEEEYRSACGCSY